MSVRDIFETMDYGPAPEDAAPAEDWLDRRDRRFGHFIAGAFTAPGPETFETANPATGAALATLSEAGPGEIDAAVAAARKAQPGWWKLGPHGRARHLYALARLMQKHARLFAVLETLDNGKPIRESRDIDVPLAVRHFYHHAGAAQLMAELQPGRVPHGVCGQIVPWNFPLLMLAWKIAPALAMGNTVVLKPAEWTSLSALLFAETCLEAGLPAGVVNIVTGAGATGAALARHGGIDKLAFTGSTAVGREIRRATAGQGKALTLELGGKSPYIVFDDADLDSAVEGLVDAIWFNQGQVCCAGLRLLVQEGVADRFHDRLRARMDGLRLGDPLDKAIDIGAIVDPVQRDRIAAMVAAGEAEGAEVFRAPGPLPSRGCFYPPVLVTGLAPASALMQEEIFGPVLVSTTFRTPAEAAALANDTRYGLAASIWSENVNLALGLAPRIAAGVVWINGANMFDAAAGFGGRRESGFGREGGPEGLSAYTRAADAAAARPLAAPKPRPDAPGGPLARDGVDRTAKLYVGGRQARPDGGQALPVVSPRGRLVGHVGRGNRKDIRNAVEAARKAQPGWAAASGHLRAQILYYVAENLAARGAEFAARLRAMTGAAAAAAEAEVAASVDRLFTWAAWADKHDGAVHDVPIRGLALGLNEPVGVVGAFCPEEAPLLGLVSVLGPLAAMGNAAVLVAPETAPLAATDFYQVLDTSDMPAGVVNIVTGRHDELAAPLAGHLDVDAVWYFGAGGLSAAIEAESAGNLKRTWVNDARARDWHDPAAGAGREFLRQSVEVKTVWVPYGE